MASLKPAARKSPERMPQMWDLLAIAFTIVFYALALWYVQGCEKLR